MALVSINGSTSRLIIVDLENNGILVTIASYWACQNLELEAYDCFRHRKTTKNGTNRQPMILIVVLIL